MDGMATILLTYGPSLVGGALSRRVGWAALVGAALMCAVVLSIISMVSDRRIEGSDLAIFVVTFAAYGAIAGAVAYAVKKLVLGIWRDPAATMTLIGGALFMVVTWTIYIGVTSGYIYALWTDARDGRSGIFMLDLFVPPFGAGRGVLKFFGLL